MSFAHFAEAKITGAIAITYTTPALRALEHGYCTYPEAIKEHYLDPTKFADPIDSAVEPQIAKGTTTAAD